MAAKNKNRKRHKATKVTFEAAENEPEAEDGGGEEDGDPAEGGGEGPAEKHEDEFSLEEVLRLGGTQADYVFLAGLDETNELVDGGKKDTIDDLEEGELEKFITKLGIRTLSGQQVIRDEAEGDGAAGSADKEKSKKVKAKKASAEEEERPSAQQKVTKEQQAENKQVKKNKDAQVPAGKKARHNASVFEFQPRQDPQLVSRYKALAQQLLEAEVELYKSKKTLQKGANSTWMKTVVSSGVLADRMAAMTVLIQDAPVHGLEHVENLVSMVKKKGSRRMGLMALDTLRELLLSDLLPEDRKLRPFAQHPFDQLEEKASGNGTPATAAWSSAHDTVPATKAKALSTAHELLCSRPEQERALLIQVVNKLGDPEYKTAAKASYLLETLLHKHPNMKAVVCCEVERLMFRPNISTKAQYYAVCFLSQVMLSHGEAELAAKLITIYFSFFRACVKKKDIESKMLSALLSGVNGRILTPPPGTRR
ncbi:hypothetical protein INR49_017986 [Caranx melampygus]|nr:hypothetical protein INR49_017986 [Caranx melampygus]